ncbi:MAG: TIGR03986 family CRISPR-associated RAMP protein [Methylococcaceae bacterium]
MTTNDKSWKFHAPRWQISAELCTDSPLHIGSGETATHPELTKLDELGREKAVEINACIKDYAGKPYLPATTLKGKLFAWLDARIPETGEQHEDLNALFGTSSDKEDSGIGGRYQLKRSSQSSLSSDKKDSCMGGRAEFHDAVLITPLAKDGKNYPYWNPDSQTYIDASIAINRLTRTIAHRKLFYTELVPPNVRFLVVITGMMTEQQAALLITALQAFPDTERVTKEPNRAATFGADDSSGKGRMYLSGDVSVKRMDVQQVCAWLNSEPLGMAEQAFTELNKDDIKKLTAEISAIKLRTILELTLQMDGAFLINNPAAVPKENKQLAKENKEPDQQPLLDTDGKPLLSGKSLRGALRSQAERIMRTLGIACCDTENPCPAIYKKTDINTLCPVCQVFGATGWQSPLHIHPFKYVKTSTESGTQAQNFVAIDRFHGGGKHTALFNARFSLRPRFKGFIEPDERMPSWGKGLLVLVLRDLHEGDIKLGFGANKGYGGVESITITTDIFFTDNDVKVFRAELSNFKKLSGFDAEYQLNPELVTDTVTPINPTAPPANTFYNPYQFIPVKEPDTNTWLNKDDLNTAKNPHSHALYRQELYHGRLRCTLKAETPVFIGAEKTESNNGSAKVENYKFNGQLAIPATSLRGMISSLAEAASNSALRVLDNGLLSYRKTMDSTLNKDRPLSAIGMVIGQGENLKLIPLALPTLRQTNGRYPLPREFRTLFPEGKAALKVYLNNAYGVDSMATFLVDKKTWSVEKPEIYYLNLDSLHLKIENNELICKEGFEELLRKPSGNVHFVIGQNSEPKNYIPVPAHQATEAQKKFWTSGILRILGKEHRVDMPNTKKHELFIPVPCEFAENFEQFIQTAQTFTIDEKAIKRFHDLAKQRTESQNQDDIRQDEQRFPYHLKGTKRLPDDSKPKNEDENYQLRLKQGDLVYFRPDENNPNIVAEVSFSAHWRGRVEDQAHQAAKVFDFFPKDLLPFNSDRTKKLSPAELLFGFIEGEDRQGNKPENALAFAGKVRIGTGLVTSAELLEPDPITLKILASPKLPSPALYFRTQSSTQAYIVKHALNTNEHQAKGRKHYLHALRRNDDPKQVQKISPTGNIANNDAALFPWQSRYPEKDSAQKVKITPIKQW